MNPENPLNLPFVSKTSAPSTLTLLSLIRADINRAIAPFLSRQDEKAFVLASSVANGVFVSAIALSKTGEYRFLEEMELTTVLQMWELKQEQYNDQQAKQKSTENQKYEGHSEDEIHDGGWLSAIFHVENDGFVSKTEYNYDKRVYSGPTPEQWFIAPETATDDYRSVWSDEEYLADLEKFPRKSGKHEWLS